MPYVYIAVMYIHVIGLTATLFLHGYHALCYSLQPGYRSMLSGMISHSGQTVHLELIVEMFLPLYTCC